MTEEKFRAWYQQNKPAYEGLVGVVCETLESLLRRRGVDYLSVTGRAKEIDSAVRKMLDKGYADPMQDFTDLCGVRVITFIESGIERTSEVIKTSFRIHPDKSIDKTTDLGINRVGYRSVQYVCDLGADRIRLPEFEPYKDLLFEIQVRTVLQHAWAEIWHDRGYKFSGTLPEDIQRRFNIVAGVLETADRELNGLADEIDSYKGAVRKKARRGDFTIPLNSVSLRQYMETKGEAFPCLTLDLPFHRDSESMIQAELDAFGVSTLEELERLFSKDFLKNSQKHVPMATYLGIIRNAMMWADLDRYFAKAWRKHWVAWDQPSQNLLAEKYGNEKIVQVAKKYKVGVMKE